MMRDYERGGYAYLHDGAVRLKQVEFLDPPGCCWMFEGGWYNGRWRQVNLPFWLLKEEY